MKKVFLMVIAITTLILADSYTLTIDQQGGQGTATLPTPTSIKYQHDGSVVPTDTTFVLDSIQVHATDEKPNVGPSAWIFIKITPVNDNAPEVQSDTVTVIEGGTKTWSPLVIDKDN